MNQQVPLKEIVTVSEMSRMCGLSRARFYQLANDGVFPKPSRNEETGRPFFNREQQEQCLLVKRPNKGVNRKPVMFYGCRLEAPQPQPKRKQLPIPGTPRRQGRQNPVVTELRHGLAQLGMTNSTDADIRQALLRTYPDGHQGVESAELLRTIFGELQRRNTADNLSG